MEPLSREVLIKQGSCCGNQCKNCPYREKWTKGSTEVSNDSLSTWVHDYASGLTEDRYMIYDPIRLNPFPTSQGIYGSCNSDTDCPEGVTCANGECVPTPSAFDEVLKEHSRIVERLLNPFKDLGTEEEAKIALDTQRRLAGNNLQYINPGHSYYDFQDQRIKINDSDSILVLNVPYDAMTVQYRYPHTGVTSTEYK